MIRIVTARRLAELQAAAARAISLAADIENAHHEYKHAADAELEALRQLHVKVKAAYRQELQMALADLSSLRESHHRLWQSHRALKLQAREPAAPGSKVKTSPCVCPPDTTGECPCPL